MHSLPPSPDVPTPRAPHAGGVLSVVIPVLDEAPVLAATHERVVEALGDLPDFDLEVVYVDDGSTDASREIIRRLHARDSRVRGVLLSRNFGHQTAVTAGLKYAKGDVVVILDADLQDPPEVALDMLQRWREGWDVAFGRRRSRAGESGFKVWTAKAFYRLMHRLSEVEIPLDTGDFRLMDRTVVDALDAMPEQDRYLRGMVAWLGFHQTEVLYDRDERAAGTTKYPLKRMLGFALDGVVSFSTLPLRIMTMLGFAVSGAALMGMAYVLVVELSTGRWVPGWTLLLLAVTLLGGVQLVALGIIGEYVGRIFRETKRRPLYLVQELVGAEVAAAAQTRPSRRA